MRIWLYVCIPMLCAGCVSSLVPRSQPQPSAPVPPPLVVTRPAEISCKLQIPAGPPPANAANDQDALAEGVATDQWFASVLDAVASYARCVVKQTRATK